MVRVETYVFLDLETSNLPCYDGNTTKITEISLVAVKRDHVPDLPFGETPRVQHKLTLCLYPRKMISPESTRVTGLSNDLLEKEPTFNLQTFSIIDTFLSALTEPVCLIAHNGHSFDFPILKNNMEKLNVKFAHEILCADSLYSFYDLDILNSKMEELKSFTDVIDFHQPSSSMQTVNESTPKRRKIVRDLPKKVVRRLFYENAEKPEESYKLEQVYRRVLGKHPQGVAHRAENDCIMLLEICMVYGTMFVHWIDQNSTLFSDVKPMTIGVKLGLLLITGVLWGCTNPFIRQGTKGFRDVKAATILGQVWAEIWFLLSNWKYVVPWLVNQSGSLVYLRAVQLAPLSVAVPVANGVTFALTAITGAAAGLDKPLDKRSILGIILIILGTSLCCWS